MTISEITKVINESGEEIAIFNTPLRHNCNLLLKIACEHLRLLKKLEEEDDDGR